MSNKREYHKDLLNVEIEDREDTGRGDEIQEESIT